MYTNLKLTNSQSHLASSSFAFNHFYTKAIKFPVQFYTNFVSDIIGVNSDVRIASERIQKLNDFV